MKNINPDPTGVPIYLKDKPVEEWPKDKFFYILSREGLFRCRNTEFFRSCVPLKGGPKELASQEEFLRMKYPKLPRELVERAVGFFLLIAEKQNSEAAAIWVWNRLTKQVELIIPDQTAINGAKSHYAPRGFPMDVKYEIPPLLSHQVVIGDIHCHVDGGAYASGMDTEDEVHRPGIHIVVGHIADREPQFHCEAVVDGERFSVSDLSMVWEGFTKADTASVPKEWLAKVKVKEHTFKEYAHPSVFQTSHETPDRHDKEVIDKILKEFSQHDECPSAPTLSQNLYRNTNHVRYQLCDTIAKDFVEGWHKEEDQCTCTRAMGIIIKSNKNCVVHHENIPGKE